MIRRILLTSAFVAMTAVTGAAQAATLRYYTPGDTSAYVSDNASGSAYTNYAFNSTTDAFVGSWEVDQGPYWNTSPPPIAYSGVDAAALLFGGSPSDYVISTVDNNPANINRLAWVSVIYIGTDTVADTFVQGTPFGGVPEPATWALMVAGFGGLGATLRSRRKTATAQA